MTLVVLPSWSKVRHYIRPRSRRIYNTLRYLFFHIRCGIYCYVENGVLRSFIPFANAAYRNNWPALIFAGGSLKAFMRKHTSIRRALYKNKRVVPERVLPVEEWWANGGLLCNVRGKEVWGQAMFKELLQAVSKAAPRIGTAEFFLNKRDRPVLRLDGMEPYQELFGEDVPSIFEASNEWMREADLLDEPTVANTFGPIFSFYTDPDVYADMHMPIVHEHVGGYPSRRVDWSDKRSSAVFRGSATGNGVTPETNTRLKLASMIDDDINAKLTSWNLRHKIHNGVVDCVDPRTLSFRAGRFNYLKMNVQTEWKYLIYASGHAGASRLSQQLLSGSLVFLVESDLPQPWIYYKLTPDKHYIPIKADLSNLKERIQWARDNDATCEEIARNGRRLTRQLLDEFRTHWTKPIQTRKRKRSTHAQ